MTNAKKDAERLAQLEAEVEALKAKVDPPKSTFVPMTDAEHRDWVHQMNEKRMAMATPPEVIRDLNVLDENLLKGVRGDARAPTGRPGMIPTQQSTGGDVRAPLRGILPALVQGARPTGSLMSSTGAIAPN
jgi:hypothetical protein